VRTPFLPLVSEYTERDIPWQAHILKQNVLINLIPDQFISDQA